MKINCIFCNGTGKWKCNLFGDMEFECCRCNGTGKIELEELLKEIYWDRMVKLSRRVTRLEDDMDWMK
ncbi:MAG: hypothetical protein ACTSPB_10060 [Candidatus Thorarchaeota archaeon]